MTVRAPLTGGGTNGAHPAPPRTSLLRRIATVVGKCCVAAFVTWHMFAVGVYAVPGAAEDRFAKFAQSTLLPRVSTYILLSSQWQQWNLFAPDPIRRITYYRFEQDTPDGWEEVVTLQPGSYPWWLHATRFKILGGIMEGGSPEVADRFAHLLCAKHDIAPGTRVRIVYLVSVVPWTETPQDYATWRSWNYPFNEEGAFDTACPDPPLPQP